MKKKIGQAGNRGNDVRSDCFVEFHLRDKGGIEIDLKSKVQAFYGNSIKKLVEKILAFFEIEDAYLLIEDSGAIELVLAARIETAIKCIIQSEKEYLLEMIEPNKLLSYRDRFRISRLYLPGNSPKLMINAGLHQPDGIILDLEDSVATDKKTEAAYLIRNVLRGLNFYNAERMVRINQIPQGLNDLRFVVPHGVNLVLIPKCESSEDVKKVNLEIKNIQKNYNLNNPIWLMPIIESAKGVLHAYEIATSAENIVALTIGLEDYTADIGTNRTDEASESFFARSQVVNAARAAKIQPIDSVFSDVSDMEALAKNVKKSKALGFDGMGCIHPRQIKVIFENFAPEEAEIEKAKKIVIAYNEAEAKGLGVVALGSKMIDPPIVKRALRTIKMAIDIGKLDKNWQSIQ